MADRTIYIVTCDGKPIMATTYREDATSLAAWHPAYAMVEYIEGVQYDPS